MYEIKEIKIYSPKSKIASTWNINKKCSDTTKEKLNNFLEKCEKLEYIFINAECCIKEFYWFTADDDLYLNIELPLRDIEKFKKLNYSLKNFFTNDLICIDENTSFLDFELENKNSYRSYVYVSGSKITIQIELDLRHWNSFIPTSDYFYASMW